MDRHSAELDQAQELIDEGEFDQAKVLIRGVLAKDRQNAHAWYLAASCLTDPKTKAEALRRSLACDPNHKLAQRALRELGSTPATRVTRPPVPISRWRSPRTLSCSGLIALIVVISVAAWLVNMNLQNQANATPEAIAQRFIHALLFNDEATVENTLIQQAREQTALFCGQTIAPCLATRLGVQGGEQDTGATLLTQTVTDAFAQVRLRPKASSDERCVTVHLHVESVWKVVDTVGGIGPCAVSVAAASTATLDTTGQAVMQTATQLAQTQNAMRLAPTLTALVLAPAFTQTAVVNQQNAVTTALAATQTRAVVAVTQTALKVGFTTGTPVAQTQIAATATQGAINFVSTLKGKLVAAQTVQGKGSQIVTLDANGSNMKVLNVLGVDPNWAPDGLRIAYANRQGQTWVHVMAADGSQDMELPIKDAPFGSGWVSWSPDGHKLMFEGGTRVGLHAVFISNPDGSNAKQLLDDNHAGGGTSWSADGNQAVFTKDDQIWVVNIDGSNAHPIARQTGAQVAVWAPAGGQIAFDADDGNGAAIYIMNADGTGLHRITPERQTVLRPAWSPDSQHLVALCDPPGPYNNGGTGHHLCIMNADGSNITVITGGGFEGHISWRP